MATDPTQTVEDLVTPSPYASIDAELEHLLTQLQSCPPQPNPNPPPIPEQPEPPRAASPQPPTHQELEEAALHGPAGRIVDTLAPHTEAHPTALLLQFLAAFGNLIGPGPHCMVESTRHALNLFVILVGDSSKARKGTSWNLIANLFAAVDPSWLSTRVNSARLTANGLLRALRDQQPPTDRRLLALSEEFATVVHSLKRGNGHLSPLLRCAWDNGNLPTLDNQTSRSFLAYLAFRSIFFPHESAGRGAYLSFLSQSAFFFRRALAPDLPLSTPTVESRRACPACPGCPGLPRSEPWELVEETALSLSKGLRVILVQVSFFRIG